MKRNYDKKTPGYAYQAARPGVNLLKPNYLSFIAESGGFEPSVPAIGTTVFETVPFDHSGSFPFRSNKKKKGEPFFTLKRRMRDSNPRRYDPQRFSRPPQ